MSPIGYRRLSAAVLTKAIKDYTIYHTKAAEAVRRAYKDVLRDPERYPTTEIRKRGLAGMKEAHVMQILAIRRDPGDFLFNESPFHTILGVDPERLRSLDFHKAFEVIRRSNSTLEV